MLISNMENIKSTFKNKKLPGAIMLWTGNTSPKGSYVEIFGPQLVVLLRGDWPNQWINSIMEPYSMVFLEDSPRGLVAGSRSLAAQYSFSPVLTLLPVYQEVSGLTAYVPSYNVHICTQVHSNKTNPQVTETMKLGSRINVLSHGWLVCCPSNTKLRQVSEFSEPKSWEQLFYNVLREMHLMSL